MIKISEEILDFSKVIYSGMIWCRSKAQWLELVRITRKTLRWTMVTNTSLKNMHPDVL